MHLRLMLLCAALAAPSVGCSDDAICDASALESALTAAAPGATIHMGSCRIAGAFRVPAGVTLAGAGQDHSVIVGSGDQAAVVLTPGAQATVLKDVAVESAALVGVLARGEGSAMLERVRVQATRGVGVAADGVSALTLTDVTLVGPVTAENASSFASSPAAADTATHGLLVANVPAAVLTNVSANGFALFGALLVGSGTTWQVGGASGNLGNGLMVHGGTADLAELELCRTYQGVRLPPAYGAIFAGGAEVVTSGLEVCDGDGYGLVHDSATVRHVGLSAHDNRDAALWVQRCPSFELSGPGTTLSGNRFAGLVVVDSVNVTVKDARIESTVLAPSVLGETGNVMVGDGVQLIRPQGPVSVENVTLSANQRVGLLVDLGGGAMSQLTLTGVAVDGVSDAYGVIAQNGTTAADWDSGVVRSGAPVLNDAGFQGSLPIVDAVVPAVSSSVLDVAGQGIRAVLGDCG
jgi:hypothetical protein